MNYKILPLPRSHGDVVNMKEITKLYRIAFVKEVK